MSRAESKCMHVCLAYVQCFIGRRSTQWHIHLRTQRDADATRAEACLHHLSRALSPLSSNCDDEVRCAWTCDVDAALSC
jgi:hypothetical protein